MNELLYIDIIYVYLSVNQYFTDIYSKNSPFNIHFLPLYMNI